MDVLRVAWVEGGSMRGFRDAFSKLPALVAQLGVGRVVLDLNALPDISVYDQLWLSTNFMPLLVTLPLRQAIVVLSPKRVYNHQVIEGLLMAVQLLIRFDVQFFAQADAAMQWTTDYSPRLAHLQQEWSQHCPPTARNTDEVAEPLPGYGLRKPPQLPS
ncbi:hypothetical protein A0257_20170 [Hymenobacter psoromatis]|nr:hypothetical protein A0257_20170 [Hymenobacter psoromatis]